MKQVLLSELTEVTAGQGAPQNERDFNSTGTPFVRAGSLEDLIAGKDEDSLERITPEAAHRCRLKLFPKDTVLFAKSGMSATKDRVYKLKRPAYVVSHLAAVTPKNDLDADYLMYFLRFFRPSRLIKDPSYPSIGLSDVEKIRIKKLDLHHQKSLTETLRRAELIIAKRREAIRLADEFLKSAFIDMFGDPSINDKKWETRDFDYFAKIDTKMTTDFKKYKDLPHIGISNIEKNTGKLFGYKLVKDENLISGKYIFTPNHIIYSKIRPNLNKVALPDFHGLASADSYPILVRTERTNKYFFTYILRSPIFMGHILKHSQRTNIPKANKDQIRTFRSIAPPVDLQKKFADLVQKVEALKAKQKQSETELQNLFNCLMQKAFKGELF